MNRQWVVNASPLIALAHADALVVLPSLAGELVIPEAVAVEVRAGGPEDPAALALLSLEGARVVPVEVLAEISEWGLGAGEAAVLSFARGHSGFTAVLDDREARRCAVGLGIPVLGTFGVLLKAKKAGLLPSVQAAIQRLLDAGFRADVRLVQALLDLAGESRDRG